MKSTEGEFNKRKGKTETHNKVGKMKIPSQPFIMFVSL